VLGTRLDSTSNKQDCSCFLPPIHLLSSHSPFKRHFSINLCPLLQTSIPTQQWERASFSLPRGLMLSAPSCSGQQISSIWPNYTHNRSNAYSSWAMLARSTSKQKLWNKWEGLIKYFTIRLSLPLQTKSLTSVPLVTYVASLQLAFQTCTYLEH